MQKIILRKLATAVQSGEEASRKFWNTMSDFYHKHSQEGTKKNYEAIAPFLSLKSASSLLDAGSGVGDGFPILTAISSPNLKVTLLDISDENVSKAKAKYGDKAEIKRGNAESLPFKPNSFDAYIANGLLESVDNPDWVINEAFRTLRPGGKAAFSLYGRMGICNVLRIYRIISNTLRLEKGNFLGKFELSEPEKVGVLLKNAGFVNPMQFYEQYHYPQLSVDELFSMYCDNPVLQEEAKAKGKTKQLEKLIKDELENILEVKQEPLTFESLIFIATKPS
jgi:ubiquinone/menaquinone biosynthesis C-methylase UbiE